MRYYVAKTPKSGFVGSFTLEEVAAQLKTGTIQETYVATASTGPSYAQLLRAAGVPWVMVSRLLARGPSAFPSVAADPSTQTEAVAMGSGWATFLRGVGMVSAFAGIAGFFVSLASSMAAVGAVVLVGGVASAGQSFLLAFLVEVVIDIHWFTRTLVAERSHGA